MILSVVVVALVVCGGTAVPPGSSRVFSAEVGEPKAGADKGGLEKKAPAGEDADYLPIGAAIEKTRTDYLPLVIYYDGGPDSSDKNSALRDKWESYMEGRFFRRKFRGVLLVRLTDADLAAPYPGGLPEFVLIASDAAGVNRPDKDQPLAEAFGVNRGYPSLLLLEFRERVARRYVEKLPSKGKIQKQILGLRKKSRVAAARARRVEKALEESQYASKLKKPRVAVQKLLPFFESKTRQKLDPVTRDRLEKVEGKYRKVVRQVADKVDVLEEIKKYAEAIKLLEELSKDYPFPDVLKECHKSRARIYRKAQTGI